VKVAVADGMAEVQSLDKPVWVNICKHLAEHFTICIFDKYSDMQQIRLIFDRYDVFSSLRSNGTQDPIPYHITDSTHISEVPLKKLLSHTKTKAELTDFL